MDKTLDLDYEFKVWTIFNQASEAAIKCIDTQLYRDLEISYEQLGVMYVIKNSTKPLSPTEISRILLREPHTSAAMMNRMEKKGLIKKSRDSKMKNVKRVSLTPKGEELYTQAMDMGKHLKLISVLSPKEKKSLLAISEKIRNEALNQLTVRRLWEPLFG